MPGPRTPKDLVHFIITLLVKVTLLLEPLTILGVRVLFLMPVCPLSEKARKIKWFLQGHTASKGWNWDSSCDVLSMTHAWVCIHVWTHTYTHNGLINTQSKALEVSKLKGKALVMLPILILETEAEIILNPTLYISSVPPHLHLCTL